jgi:peroxiredoxin
VTILIFSSASLALAGLVLFSADGFAAPPQTGQVAPRFTLNSLSGQRVTVPAAGSKTALIVLRGFPGYQCPLCKRQVQDFIRNAQAFQELDIKVVMVYPGPAAELEAKAKEMMLDKSLPANFELLLDPGYQFTNLYGLRWDAPKETAYPATFLINGKGEIYFAKISNSHGGRATAAEAIEAIKKYETAK